MFIDRENYSEFASGVYIFFNKDTFVLIRHTSLHAAEAVSEKEWWNLVHEQRLSQSVPTATQTFLFSEDTRRLLAKLENQTNSNPSKWKRLAV